MIQDELLRAIVVAGACAAVLLLFFWGSLKVFGAEMMHVKELLPEEIMTGEGRISLAGFFLTSILAFHGFLGAEIFRIIGPIVLKTEPSDHGSEGWTMMFFVAAVTIGNFILISIVRSRDRRS